MNDDAWYCPACRKHCPVPTLAIEHCKPKAGGAVFECPECLTPYPSKRAAEQCCRD